MFDNCSPEMIRENISKVPDHIMTEASGGITFEKIDVYSNQITVDSETTTYALKALDKMFERQ